MVSSGREANGTEVAYTLSVGLYFIAEREREEKKHKLRSPFLKIVSLGKNIYIDVCYFALSTFMYFNFFPNKKQCYFQMMTTKTSCCLGWAAQLVRASFKYAKGCRFEPRSGHIHE